MVRNLNKDMEKMKVMDLKLPGLAIQILVAGRHTSLNMNGTIKYTVFETAEEALDKAHLVMETLAKDYSEKITVYYM